eukprot:COSAG02_NODE_1182_length_14021_cov_4.502442_5_plen_152_part_00
MSVSFFKASGGAPGQPRSSMGTDGRLTTPLLPSQQMPDDQGFFASPSQDLSGKRRSNLHDLSSHPALKSMVAATPQAQSKIDSIIHPPDGPDVKRRRAATSEPAPENKSVRAVTFNDASNIAHSPEAAAMLQSHLLPSHAGYALPRPPFCL